MSARHPVSVTHYSWLGKKRLLKINFSNYRELQKSLFREAEEARLQSSKKKKKKKKKSKSPNADDDASVDSSMTLSLSLTTNGVDGDDTASNDDEDDVELGNTDDKGGADDVRSSPKRKKKKKEREKKERLIIPELFAHDRKLEPRINKIVIVNGTKIQSQPGSPIPAPVKSLSPLSLRSASPKITLKTEPMANPVATVVPPPENPQASGPLDAEAAVAAAAAVVDVAKRKRKLSVDGTGGRKVAFKSRKRLRTASLKDLDIAVDAAAADDAPIDATTPTTTHPPTKVLPASKSREEKTSVRSLSVTPSSTPVLGGRRRETPNGYPAITLSENLKRHLNSDYEMVTKKRRLNSLPAEPNIVTVLEDFVRHYSSGRLVAFEKHQRKSLYTAHRRDTGEMTYQRAIESIQVRI